MVRAASVTPSLAAVIIALLVLLAGCQQSVPPPAVDTQNQRALAPATLPYSISKESGALVVRRGAAEVVVEADLGDSDWQQIVPLPDERFAVLAGRKLGAFDADGMGPIVPLDADCGSLTPAGQRILLLCPGSDVQGSEFRIRIFDLALHEVDSLDLNRVHERTGAGMLVGNEGAPDLVAVGADAMWIGYPDRNGWGRGGSRLVAKHDYQGRVLATLHVDGAIYDKAQSPDGRYLAMFAGGSSGAMDTVANLRVIDLGLMTVLNTAPDTPAAAMSDSRSDDDVYFTGSYFTGNGLRWIDEHVVVATGSTEHHADIGTDRPQLWWERRFDVGAVGVTDRPIPEPPDDSEQGWVGPGCDDIIETVDRDNGGVPTRDGLRLRQGDQTRMLTTASLLYAAPKPKECRP